MNKQNAAQFLPLVQAMAEGKTIQWCSPMEGWKDLTDLDLGGEPQHYRIKPEPRKIWVNFYKNNYPCVHETLELALEGTYETDLKQKAVPFIEVL